MPRLGIIFTALLGLVAHPAYAHTTVIHAVGINPKDLEENHDDFYSEAEDFLSYCKSAGLKLGTDCKLFIDLDTKRSAGVGTHLKKSQTLGGSTPAKVLKAFEVALETAKPGDQVVLSLNNHGGPGLVHSSCIYTGPGDLDTVCMADVAAVLKKRKKPGVKVFINADACMSGAFSELATRDVCTLVAADRFRYAGGSSFWGATMQARNKKGPLLLSQIKSTLSHNHLEMVGGGFGSQVIQTRLCELKPQDWSLKDRNDLATIAGRDASGLHLKMEDLANSSCNKVTLDENIASIYNLAGNMSAQLEKLPDPLVNSIRVHCTHPSASNKQLCADLIAYKKEFEASSLAFIESLRENLENKQDQLYFTDAQLGTEAEQSKNKRQLADLEAKRGELLKELIAEKVELANKVHLYLQQQHHQKLAQILTRIHDELCFDFRKSNASQEERIMSRLTLSALRGDRVPDTDRAYKDALACESSFQLP